MDSSFPKAPLNHNGALAVAGTVVGFADKGLPDLTEAPSVR